MYFCSVDEETILDVLEEAQCTSPPPTKNKTPYLDTDFSSAMNEASHIPTITSSARNFSLSKHNPKSFVPFKYLTILSTHLLNFSLGLFCQQAHLCTAKTMSGLEISASHHN